MSAKSRDEILTNFIAITQCSRQDARGYLEAANWNEETAMEFFFDSGRAEIRDPVPPTSSRPNETKPYANIPSKREPSRRSPSGSDDDDLLQSALEQSLQMKVQEKSSPATVPKRVDNNKSIISSKINTVDTFRKNKEDSDDDEDEGQAFYAGGSERSGQQIIGPPKARDNDKNVTKIFNAARKQGAAEAHDDESTASSRSKNEKPFTGVGYSLNDNNTPSRNQVQPSSGAAAAAVPPPNAVEQLPIRFYSNGFTVGDGELRRFEDNKEFMEYIKRGEVPPELKNMNTNGRQIEVRLEDRRGEEYKRVAPGFKPFGGTGHTVGLPPASRTQYKSSIASPVNTSTEPPDASRLEQLAEKRLKTSSSSTTIRLRLPDMSTPVCIKIDLNRTLGDVRKFLSENIPSLQSNTFEFMEPPSTKIKREDERRKIADVHLSNSTIAVRRTA